MNFFKRWRLLVVAMLAALAVTVTGTVSASAASAASSVLPGEEGSYHDDNLRSTDTLHEARDVNGNLLQVWRGADNDAVWVALNNGTPYQIGTTHTAVSPTVVAYGQGFAIFHIGTDHQIYWNRSTAALPSNQFGWGSWQAIPGNVTLQSFSVTQIGGPGSRQLFGVYRAYSPNSNDQRLWSIYTGGTLRWNNAALIPGATSDSAPTVTWTPENFNGHTNGTLWVVHRGTDNNTYMAIQSVGTNAWTAWSELGAFLPVINTASPVIMSSGNNLLVAVRDPSGHLWETHRDASGWAEGFQPITPTNWETSYAPGLSTLAGAIILLFTGLQPNPEVWYKTVWRP